MIRDTGPIIERPLPCHPPSGWLLHTSQQQSILKCLNCIKLTATRHSHTDRRTEASQQLKQPVTRFFLCSFTWWTRRQPILLLLCSNRISFLADHTERTLTALLPWALSCLVWMAGYISSIKRWFENPRTSSLGTVLLDLAHFTRVHTIAIEYRFYSVSSKKRWHLTSVDDFYSLN